VGAIAREHAGVAHFERLADERARLGEGHFLFAGAAPLEPDQAPGVLKIADELLALRPAQCCCDKTKHGLEHRDRIVRTINPLGAVFNGRLSPFVVPVLHVENCEIADEPFADCLLDDFQAVGVALARVVLDLVKARVWVSLVKLTRRQDRAVIARQRLHIAGPLRRDPVVEPRAVLVAKLRKRLHIGVGRQRDALIGEVHHVPAHLARNPVRQMMTAALEAGCLTARGH
jgi:hypothetical protein